MRHFCGFVELTRSSVTDFEQKQEDDRRLVKQMLGRLSAYPWQSEDLVTGGRENFSYGLGIQMTSELPSKERLFISWKNYRIAFDGRLDNRAELAENLNINAAEWLEIEDSQLILRAYDYWGSDCVAKLLGDFAFALWDENRQQLLCARDFVGVRPFYYYLSKDQKHFIFANDLQSLTAHPQIKKQLNLAYVKAELETSQGQFQHPHYTFLQDIYKLIPARYLVFNLTGLTTTCYWQPGQNPDRVYAQEEDYIQEMLSLLEAAIACRCDSPFEVGAHLSGGLDSSSMAVLGDRYLKTQGKRITGFSWAPPLPDDPQSLEADDERHFVEAVRQEADLTVRYNRLTSAHYLTYQQRDYTVQPTTTLQLELATSEEAASLGIRTILSGWGGDELLVFNGRGYFADLLRRGQWGTCYQELKLRNQLHGGKVWKDVIIRGLFPCLPLNILKRIRPKEYPDIAPLPSYLKPDFATALAAVEPLGKTELRERPGARRMQIALLQNGHIPYRLESWASHGMSLGLTYAFPLLDRRIVEFALSIPDYYFFKNGWKRYLYRSGMAGILPDSVRWNKHKTDPAMAAALKKVNQATFDNLVEIIQQRSDNPYLEVDPFLAVLKEKNQTTDDQKKRRLFGRGQWLLFISEND
jgi:asparagine synthase (glutamine-hydrolysing)